MSHWHVLKDCNITESLYFLGYKLLGMYQFSVVLLLHTALCYQVFFLCLFLACSLLFYCCNVRGHTLHTT